MPYESDPAVAREALHKRIDNDFAAHPPKSHIVKESLDIVAGKFADLAHFVIDECPPGRELSLCLTNLEAAKRDAIAAIACHQGD